MVIKLLLGLFVILVGAELFTNAIEWLGKKLKLSEGVVGNLLAAVGTALPESIVPIVAFCNGGAQAVDIGIGAILGAPFMLGTLALFIVGVSASLFSWRGEGRRYLLVDHALVLRDLRFFMLMYSLVIMAAFIHTPGLKYVIIVALLLGYLCYIAMAMKSGHIIGDEHLKPLYFKSSANPSLVMICIQLTIGLAAIVFGAHFFVGGIEQLALVFGIQPLILALVIAPIATELPEKFNSVIWIAQKKDGLALGNIIGAMAFQSTIIPAFGIAAIQWRLDLPSLLSSFFLLLSIIVLYLNILRLQRITPKSLMLCGLAYVGFIAMICWSML